MRAAAERGVSRGEVQLARLEWPGARASQSTLEAGHGERERLGDEPDVEHDGRALQPQADA